MFQYVQYVGQYAGVRRDFSSLPNWARFLVTIAAIPAVVLAILSLLVLLVSILALLLLTVPVYKVLRTFCVGGGSQEDVSANVVDPSGSPGRRQVDSKVIE